MAEKSRVRLFLVFWLFVLSSVAYLDRSNINIAGVQMARDFGLGRIHLGWVFSALLIGYAGFQIPAGWLAVRYGPRLALGLGMLWWSVFTVSTTLVTPALGNVLLQLVVVRFLLGMGELVMYPAANQFIAQWIPMAERAKANGWLFAGVGVGAGLAPPLVTSLILHYGWCSAFWFSAVIGLGVGLVWYLAARDRPEQHPKVSPLELGHIHAGMAAGAGKAHGPVPWRGIFTNRAVWMLTAAYFAFGYIAFIFVNWFFIYLADAHHLDLGKSALYSVMPFLSMTVFCLAGGGVSDRLTQTCGAYVGRCVFPCLALLLCAVFLVLGSRASDPLLASVILAGGAGALYLSQSSYWAVAADLAEGHTGIVSGLINMGAQIAGAITASATPWIALNFGWAQAFYVAAGFGVFGAAAWLLVDPGQVIESAPQ